MGTYVGKIQIGNSTSNISPIASTMFYKCDSLSRDTIKVVNFDKFDKLVHGATIFVRFTNGNDLSNNIQLQVGSTLAYDITGNCVCGENEVIAFTFDEVDSTHKYWRATSSGITSAMRQFIIDTINSTSETPDVLIIKGSIGLGGNPGVIPASGYEKGWTYYVVREGEYLGQHCEPGALIIAINDALPNQSAINTSHWAVITTQNYSNGTGLDLNLNTNEFSVIYGTTAGTAAEGNDPRLSDARTPLEHTHGNISNDGTIGNGNALVRTTNGAITVGPSISSNLQDVNKYLNNWGEWTEIDFPVTSVNGTTGDITITLADLGLDAMRFVGRATVLIEEGTITNPVINNYNWPTDRINGDVILGKDDGREYVWTDDGWIMLGFSASQIMDSNNITGQAITPVNVPTWISRVTQNTDGSVRVERATIDILPINHGGTGTDTLTENCVVLTDANATALISRSYTDNTSATDFLSTSNNFITERSIYHGLPFINGVHNYTSNEEIFAPETTGDEFQILVSHGSGAPLWARAALIESIVSETVNTDAITTLTLGNRYARSSADAHSEGKIFLYSSNTGGHEIDGDSTSNIYTHTLPNATGIFVQIPDDNAVGSNDCPVYISANGTATALEYTPNRLYYSHSSSEFLPTEHYANANQIGINITSWPSGLLDSFYVQGNSTLNGNVNITTGIVTITNNTAATTNGAGALIVTGGIYTAESLFANKNLHITEKTTLLNRVSIGEELVANEPEILTIHGNTKIKGDNNIVAYLTINTIANSDYLYFRPNLSGNGIIGDSSYAWKSAAFTDEVTVIDSNSNGITIDSNGFIDVVHGNSTINLTTIDSQNEVGIISINTAIPTIELNTTTAASSQWIMNNTAGNFSLNNQESVLIELKGTDYGFELTNRLYINPASNLSSSSNLDLYVNGYTELYNKVGIGIIPDTSSNGTNILTINGNTLIVSDDAEAAHIDVVNIDTNIYSVSFYPENDTTGSIGLDDHRWKEGYFSDLLAVGTYEVNTITNGVLLDQNGIITIKNTHTDAQSSTTTIKSITLDTNTVGQITISSTTPTILLDTTASGGTDWIITNHDTANVFSLRNQKTISVNQIQTTAELQGTDNGFALISRLYINPTQSVVLDSQARLDLFVAGTTELFNNTGIGTDPDGYYKLTIASNLNDNRLIQLMTDDNYQAALIDLNSDGTVDFYPKTTNTGSLGLPNTGGNVDNGSRWKKLYIGEEDTHGDEYTPIYWKDGAPYKVPVVQQYDFTISLADDYISLPNRYAEDAIVTSIVVTEGMSYLRNVIQWEFDYDSQNGNHIHLFTASNVDNDVKGYILVSTGYDATTPNT